MHNSEHKKGLFMQEIRVPFRLGADYTKRLDTIVKRLGIRRPNLFRNLLSLDPVLIDNIEDKAKTLKLIDIVDDMKPLDKAENEKDVGLVTIRLDEEQERRFNALVESLGVGSKVQVLRQLLSGDARTVATVCAKAKSIPLNPLEELTKTYTSTPEVQEETKVIEELIRRKVNEFENELRVILMEQRANSIGEIEISKQVEIL